jgi:NhaP-type Na+/H+ or K+/H+ antiporter
MNGPPVGRDDESRDARPDDATPATGASSDGFHLDDVKNAGIEFLKVVGIGILAGLVLGLGCMAVLRFINDHTLETAITIVLAWGSFLFVEYLHGSGVIAVVVIGLVMGNYGRNLSMSEETRLTVEGFWDAIAFVVNSLVFLLIGTELQDVGPAAFLSITGVIIPAIIAFLPCLVSRGLQVYPIAWLYRHRWIRTGSTSSSGPASRARYPSHSCSACPRVRCATSCSRSSSSSCSSRSCSRARRCRS